MSEIVLHVVEDKDGDLCVRQLTDDKKWKLYMCPRKEWEEDFECYTIKGVLPRKKDLIKLYNRLESRGKECNQVYDRLQKAHEEIDRLIERLDDLTGSHIELHKDYNDKNNECDRLKDEIVKMKEYEKSGACDEQN